MLDSKVIGASAAVVTVAGVGIANHSPDGFWPVTISGWLALATSVSALVVSGYLLYKKSLSPVVDSVDDLKEHFDTKIEALEEKYDAEFERMREGHERGMNSFTQAVHDRLNGFGARLEQNETDYEVINRQMGESQEDRRHLNQQLSEIRVSQQEIIKLLLQQPHRRG